METALVRGRAIPKFDSALMVFLGAPEVDFLTEGSTSQFGIENSDGEIYRIVGAESDLVYATLIGRLRDLRYRIEPLEDTAFKCCKTIARTPPEL